MKYLRIKIKTFLFVVPFFISFFIGNVAICNEQNQDVTTMPKGFLNPTTKIVRSKYTSPKIKSTIFEEKFESGATDWYMDGEWEVGFPTSGPNSGHNSSNCAATDLHDDYSNSSDYWLISPEITLGTATEIKLYFWEWFELESGYDYGRVKISTDGGTSWTQLTSSNGTSDWRETEVDLTVYQNETVFIAFNFTSDSSVIRLGWYIDDIRIETQEPEPLTATMTSINSQNFPFIYMNVAVDSMGIGTPNLTQSNFQVYENGTLQTDYFEVTPPETGGGARLADIVFLMDNSGSMQGEQNAVENNVIDFVDNLVNSGVDFSLGLCRYGQSANSGSPIIEDNGILTSDATYFKYDVWQRNVVDGRDEPGYYAIVQSSNSFSFRPGAQKIFIIITDETPDQGGASEQDALDACVNNSITLFALTESGLYSRFQSITTATNGAYFDIYSNFDDILDYISAQVANTYLVRYRSSDPAFNGVTRNVEVLVSYFGEQDTATDSYVPGATPQIVRTQNTLDVHDQAWAEGTEFTIEVEITDDISPYTQNATLYYKNTSESNYNPTAMYLTSKSEIWEGIISGGDVSPNGLDYYITATDGQSTSSDPSVEPSSNPYQIAILPNEAPEINHTPVTTLTVNNPVTIEAEVIDNTNELDYIGLYYRKTGQLTYQDVEMTNIYSDNFEATIPAVYSTSDGVDYFLKASDNFGVHSFHGTPDSPHQIEPIYDLGFSPNPNGWKFGNAVNNMWPFSHGWNCSGEDVIWCWKRLRCEDVFPSWDLFVDAFGLTQVYEIVSGKLIKKPSAVTRWNSIKGCWGGSCFGFAISSFLAFDDKSTFLNEFPNIPTFSNLYDLSIGDETRKCINQLWIYQFGKNQQSHIRSNKSKTPIQTLNEVKQMFINPNRDDKILVFFNQNGSGGHAVNPYIVGVGTEIDTIFIYDNNAPNNSNRYILIDKTNNTWHYPNMSSWGGSAELFLMEPCNNYLVNPILPSKLPPKEDWISKDNTYLEFYNSQNSSILIEDQIGLLIGYIDSLIINDYSNGMPIIPITGNVQPPIGYNLPVGEYSIQMQEFSDSLTYFSVFTDTTVFSYSRSDANSNQTDYLIYGNSFVISSQDEQDKNIGLEAIAINEDNEKVFEIENYSIFQNDSLIFDIVERENFQISNKSQTKTTKSYDLRVKLVSANVDTTFEHKGIEISDNSSHQVTPDWDNLESIPIFIDEDMNGTFEDTIYVENQFSEGETPSTGDALNNENIYIYPNPFNPDIEVGTIRYSLAEDGEVTIKIYDIGGNLVRTLIEDESQSATDEQSVAWDGKNDKGDVVANGVYFYVIDSSSGEKATGKAAIIK